MKKTVTHVSCVVVFLGSFAMTGCGGGNTGVVEAPEVTAAEQAEIEKSQADYQKAMQESYGKGN